MRKGENAMKPYCYLLFPALFLTSISANNGKLNSKIIHQLDMPTRVQEAIFCPVDSNYASTSIGIIDFKSETLIKNNEFTPIGWVDNKILVKSLKTNKYLLLKPGSQETKNIFLELAKMRFEKYLPDEKSISIRMRLNQTTTKDESNYEIYLEKIKPPYSYEAKNGIIKNKNGDIIYKSEKSNISYLALSPDKNKMVIRLYNEQKNIVYNTITKNSIEIPYGYQYYWFPDNMTLLASKTLTGHPFQEVCGETNIYLYSLIDKNLIKISLPDALKNHCLHIYDISNRGEIMLYPTSKKNAIIYVLKVD